MPEGHSVHRIALQFRRNFVGHRCAASSPQGRFAAGAELIDGHLMTGSSAIGKHLLLEFEQERTLHVHLGLYGAWDFAGMITADATLSSADGRMGQTNQRGTFLEEQLADRPEAFDAAADAHLAASRNTLRERTDRIDALPEDSLGSIGAPRLTRLRMAESERLGRDEETEDFPPAPIGQVRVRLLTETAVADLRGPTACEVFDPEQVRRLIAKLGPDPMHDSGKAAEDRFVAAVHKSATPIGLQLMDQSVVAGIGNVYKRTGQKSPRGRGTVVMEEMGGRNLYWAPGWQTGPRKKA